MPVSEAQKKASAKYLDKLDEVRIRMPKGRKETIQAAAAAAGESVNAYINTAIAQRMERDGGGTPSVSPQKAAETTPEDGALTL